MKKFFKIIQQILSGGFLTLPEVRRIYPFLLFLVVLALFWIGNTYAALQLRREFEKTEETLKVATEELQKLEKSYAERAKRPSQLVKKLAQDSAASKLKMSHDGVYKIIVNENKGGEK